MSKLYVDWYADFGNDLMFTHMIRFDDWLHEASVKNGFSEITELSVTGLKATLWHDGDTGENPIEIGIPRTSLIHFPLSDVVGFDFYAKRAVHKFNHKSKDYDVAYLLALEPADLPTALLIANYRKSNPKLEGVEGFDEIESFYPGTNDIKDFDWLSQPEKVLAEIENRSIMIHKLEKPSKEVRLAYTHPFATKDVSILDGVLYAINEDLSGFFNELFEGYGKLSGDLPTLYLK